jgi:hypothetical protein
VYLFLKKGEDSLIWLPLWKYTTGQQKFWDSYDPLVSWQGRFAQCLLGESSILRQTLSLDLRGCSSDSTLTSGFSFVALQLSFAREPLLWKLLGLFIKIEGRGGLYCQCTIECLFRE